MIAPSGLKSWHAFAFLIVIAIIGYYFRPLLIVGGLLAGLLWGLGWLSHRFPRTMLVLLTFVNALLRGTTALRRDRAAGLAAFGRPP